LRLFGRGISVPKLPSFGSSATVQTIDLQEPIELPTPPPELSPSASLAHSESEVNAIPALVLTPEAFAAFGQVIQAYEDLNAVPSPRNIHITGANQGTAVKFHKLAPLTSSYPHDVNAAAGLSVYRCKPIELEQEGLWSVKLLERHPYTNQAFIPMGSAPVSLGTSEGLKASGHRYLVIVALNGDDDKPDLKTMRAFIASGNQGIVYNTAVWHHPMAVLDLPMDFTCVETQIGDGSPLDCEIVDVDENYTIQVPALPRA